MILAFSIPAGLEGIEGNLVRVRVSMAYSIKMPSQGEEDGKESPFSVEAFRRAP